MSSRNKRTHGDCVWYTVGATVLMALVKHVVEGIVIVVVDLFLCDNEVASGGTFVVSRLLIHLSQSDWWCGQCWCLVMSFFTFGWSIDYCYKNGMAQLHVCCCMYTCCMYAGSKFGPG